MNRPSRRAGLEAVPVAMTVFVTGCVLLAVEIAASRVVSPYFGSSLYVWGALIGVVLTGLAVGYWFGGAVADRWPTPTLLVATAGAAGAAVLAIPLIDGPVIDAVLDWDPGPRLDPLLVAAVLFGPPSILLAAVTPVAVRLRGRTVATFGRTAGSLFAVSTAGGIAGTFLTAFWLIPAVGTDQLLALAAVAVFTVAAATAAAERRWVLVIAAAGAVGGGAAAAVALAPDKGDERERIAAENWSPVYRLRGEGPVGARVDYSGFKVLLEKDTRYFRLAVLEDDTTRVLRFGSSFQGVMNLDDPYRTEIRATDFLLLGLAYTADVRRALFLGLGAGAAPKRMWRDFHRVDVQAVELDPEVVDVAYRYFELPRDPRLRVAVDDGRRWLDSHRDRWDTIAVDTFYGDALPFHMTTREFVELVRSRLTPGGVVVANVVGALEGDSSRLFRSIYRTYRSVFPTVLVHPVDAVGDQPSDVRNLVIVASDSAAPPSEAVARRWHELRALAPTAPALEDEIRGRYDRPIPIGDVPTLTDDYAPAEALLLE
jgi:spermidine synthase